MSMCFQIDWAKSPGSMVLGTEYCGMRKLWLGGGRVWLGKSSLLDLGMTLLSFSVLDYVLACDFSSLDVSFYFCIISTCLASCFLL